MRYYLNAKIVLYVTIIEIGKILWKDFEIKACDIVYRFENNNAHWDPEPFNKNSIERNL